MCVWKCWEFKIVYLFICVRVYVCIKFNVWVLIYGLWNYLIIKMFILLVYEYMKIVKNFRKSIFILIEGGVLWGVFCNGCNSIMNYK